MAVVTGASSGIGRAISCALVARGACVAALGRSTEALERARVEDGLAHGSFTPIAVDLDSGAGLAEFCGTWSARLGRVDLLVHSAGVHHRGTTAETPVDVLERLLRVNATHPYALTRALLPELVHRQGQVVFVNSTAIQHPNAHTAQFAASKAALRALADGLRAEVNDEGVRVLSVYPGRTASPTQERIFAQEGRAYRPASLLQPADVAAAVVGALALPRTAEVTDLHIRPMRKSS